MFILILVFIALAQTCQAADKSQGSKVYLPPTRRTEGRITLSHLHDGAIIQHRLAFSEVIDSQAKRSKISIGYVSYEPVEYYTQSKWTLTVDSGRCRPMANQTMTFVPELDWFARMIYEKGELYSFLGYNRHLIGPTGLIDILLFNIPNANVSIEIHIDECNNSFKHFILYTAK